ncbi:nucleoside diphosphate-linked moiety X motif 6 [Balamuthia mandrillaris]
MNGTSKQVLVGRNVGEARGDDIVTEGAEELDSGDHPTLLEGVVNLYNGVTITESALPTDPIEFGRRLQASLEIWKKQGRRGIWLNIPIQLCALVPIAVKCGFVYHSAKPDALRLTTWLADGPCLMPDGPHHTIGAGGLVFSPEREEVLVVSERYAEKPRQWKLPGGYVQAGEPLGDAVCREVFEETSVKATFKGLLFFRHTHPMLFDNADMYFVGLLEPQTFELSAEEAEISECRWMKLEEYASHPNVNAFNRNVATSFLEAYRNNAVQLFAPETLDISSPTETWARSKTFYSFYRSSLLKEEERSKE